MRHPDAPVLLGSAVLSTVLAGSLAWNIAAPADRGVEVRVPAPALPVARQPPAPLRDHQPEWVMAMLARPLFNLSRRPANRARTEAASEDLPRLTGLVISPSGSRAIFVPPSGPAVVARAGDRIGKYVVKSITERDVTLAGPGGDRVIRPTFAKQEPVSAPAPSARPRGPVIPGLTPGVPVERPRQ